MEGFSAAPVPAETDVEKADRLEEKQGIEPQSLEAAQDEPRETFESANSNYLEFAEKSNEQLDQALHEAEVLVQDLEKMELGTRETYDAAFDVRDKVEGLLNDGEPARLNEEFKGALVNKALLFTRNLTDSLAENPESKYYKPISSPDTKIKVQFMRERSEALEKRAGVVIKKMMDAWRNAKEAYIKST